jgi:hypothetical protein
LFHLEFLKIQNFFKIILNIIQLIEDKRIPESVNIIGTSYFFNNRTLKNLGFQIEKPSNFYRLNLLLNFIDLFWMYSLSRGKVAIPSVWDAKKASILGSDLIENKTKLEVLHQKLKAKRIDL